MDVKQALKLHWKAKFMVICRQQGISLYSEDAEAELEKFVDDAVALFKRLGLFMNNSAGPTDEEVLAFFDVCEHALQTPATDNLSTDDSQASEDNEGGEPVDSALPAPAAAASTTSTTVPTVSYGTTSAPGGYGTEAATADRPATPDSTNGAPFVASASQPGVFDPRERGMDME